MNQLTEAPQDEDTKQAPFIFEFKYEANKDGNGLEVFEVLVTTYTGINMNDTYGYGVQIINPSQMSLDVKIAKVNETFASWHTETYYNYIVNYGNAELYFYNTHDFVSYGATTALNKNDIPYVIDIEGNPYAFTFNQKNLVNEHTNLVGWHYQDYYVSNFDYFVYKMYDAIKNITNGDGVYENLMAKLADVFEFYEYNSLSGKFDKLTDIAYNTSFIGLKTTYLSRGAHVHEDSLFNQLGKYEKGVTYA